MNLRTARTLNLIRHRLTTMATVEESAPALRARVFELASDLERLVAGDPHALEDLEPSSLRDTVPCPPPCRESAAPPVPDTRPSGGP